MASTDSSPPHQSTSFLSLPAEIRNAIYELTINASKQRTLRPKQEVEYHANRLGRVEKASVTLVDTSPLSVNKQTSQEAAGIFYGYHSFHYSIKRRGVRQPPARLLKHIAVIKHLSISYTASYPRSIRAQRIDNVIAQHIEYITENCTQICSLNFHILANQEAGEAFRSILKAGQTSRKLRLLSPRLQRLSVITFGPSDALAEFREGISAHPIFLGPVFQHCPAGCQQNGHWHGSVDETLNHSPAAPKSQQPMSAHWTFQSMSSWPQLGISAWEYSGMDRRRYPDGTELWSPWILSRPEERIRVWNLRKPE